MKNLTKAVAKLTVVLGLGVIFSAYAAGPSTDGVRKTAVLEGKYLKIVASAPDFAGEGTDFFNRPGIGKAVSDAGNSEYEVDFAAPLAEERTGASYKVRMTEFPNQNALKIVPDAKWQAEYLLRRTGGDPVTAVQIDAPKVPFPEATVVALRWEGLAYGDAKTGKQVVYVIGVSFPGNKFGYAMAGKVITPVAAFDADPAKVDRRANRAFSDFFLNSKIEGK